MPRYEFAEGRSNKFWDISLDGNSFTTTWGKIGTAGQSAVKTFASPTEARSQHDKLVAEKVKKGYRLVESASGSAPAKKAEAKVRVAPVQSIIHDARNPELERAIIEEPTNRQAFAVLADWLQEQGDPRGELISLQLGNKDKQARAHLEKHLEYFFGPLKEHQLVHDEGANNSRSHLRTAAQEAAWEKTQQQAFLWRNGFIYRVRLSHDSTSDEGWDGKTVDLLKEVLRHPSGRFVVEFAFQSNGDPNEDDLQDLIDELGENAPLTTRKITFGDNVDQVSWHHTGDLGSLWKGVPNLRTLEIETGHFDVGAMTAPNLERAIFITGGLSQSCGRNIATASMPRIKHLEIYYGDHSYGGDCSAEEVFPLVARSDLTQLTTLGLKNSRFSDDIARLLHQAPILKTVRTLDLSLGTLTDEGAEALAAARESLTHLETLNLTRNYLTKTGVKLVKGLCPNVIVNDQQEAEDEDDRYVAIAE